VTAASRRPADPARLLAEVHQVSLDIVRVGDRPCEIPRFGDDAPEVWRDVNGVICARGGVVGGYGWMEVPNIGVFRFRPSQQDVTAFTAPRVGDEILLDCYCRIVLPLALQFFGCEVLHASAVRNGAGVVGFCAVSGTGKSTIVAALTRRGFPLWADDALVCENRETEGPRAIPVPCRMRLDGDAAEFLDLGGASREWVRRDESDAPLAALCVLQRNLDAHDSAEIRHLGSSAAITAIMPHAYCFTQASKGRKRRMMEQYFELAARAPIYLISFAPGFERLERLLDRIEREIPGFAPASHPFI
jgi:hypothetical protein